MTDTPTLTTPDFAAILTAVHGFLSVDEAALLYRLASEVPAGGNIVEIGSYRARSTICLALGAKVNGATVWSIDPHEDYTVDNTHYGMIDNQHYYENIAKFGVGDVVKTINLPSTIASIMMVFQTDLLWIDGCHLYKAVAFDFRRYSRLVIEGGKIALHDTAGYHPDVSRLLDEILAAGQWERVEMVDATTVLQRVKQL